MTRSALDAALLLQPMAGYDPLDPTSVERPCPTTRGRTVRPVRPLRIGVLRGSYLWDLLAPGIGNAVETALGELCRLGLSIEDVEAARNGRRPPMRAPSSSGRRPRRSVPASPGGAARGPDSRGAGASRGRYPDVGGGVPRRATRLGPLCVRAPPAVRTSGRLGAPGRAQTAPKMEESGRLLEPLSRATTRRLSTIPACPR
jgi:hypothetical protein